MTCLVIVEGPTDKAVVEGVAGRLGVGVKVLVMRGNKPGKAARLANAELATGGYSKVVVLKDQHEHPQDVVSQRLKEITANIRHDERHALVVKRSIEAWILACMGVVNPEGIDDPEAYLDRLLRRSGKRYVKTPGVVGELLKDVDLRKALGNSSTLRRFVGVLRGC